MSGWITPEQQAQLEYGRQMSATTPSYLGNTTEPNSFENGNYKPRQFGGPRRVFNKPNDNSNEFEKGDYERERGHMMYLRSLQRTGSQVRVVTVNGDVVQGAVKDCDDQTLTLRVPKPTEINPNAYQNRVFIKQNLVEFAPIVPGVSFS